MILSGGSRCPAAVGPIHSIGVLRREASARAIHSSRLEAAVAQETLLGPRLWMMGMGL